MEYQEVLFFYFLCATSVNQSVNYNRLEENGMNTDYKPIKPMKEVPNQLRKLQRKYLRYQ